MKPAKKPTISGLARKLGTKYENAGDLIKAMNAKKISKHQLLATQSLKGVAMKGLI